MADVISLSEGRRAVARRPSDTRLRESIAGHGSVSGAFLLYLSSRADLIPATDCLVLATIPDRAPASPWFRVRESLGRELGRAWGADFEQVEAEPCDAGLLFQWHHARLTDGTPVTVKLVRPELHDSMAADLARLVTLTRDLGDTVLDRAALERGLVDFRRALQREMNLLREAEALEQLAGKGNAPNRSSIPGLVRSCCSERVLTYDRQIGSTLESLLVGREGVESRMGARRSLRLCRLWLALALDRGLFPCDPRGRNVRFHDNGKISFAGPFGRLPPETQNDLLEYLSAVAGGELDRAADALLRASPTGSAEVEGALRQRIRHAEPFRDRSWDFDGERFVKLVLMHWREARELGLRLRPELDDFFRGLFVLARESHGLEPDRGAVLEGLRDLRLSMTVGELGRFSESDALAELAGRQLSILLSLPQKLDRALSLVAETRTSRDPRSRKSTGEGGRRGVWAAMSALLLALVAVVAVVHHLGAAGPSGGWIEIVGAGMALLLGGLALRAGAGRR